MYEWCCPVSHPTPGRPFWPMAMPRFSVTTRVKTVHTCESSTSTRIYCLTGCDCVKYVCFYYFHQFKRVQMIFKSLFQIERIQNLFHKVSTPITTVPVGNLMAGDGRLLLIACFSYLFVVQLNVIFLEVVLCCPQMHPLYHCLSHLYKTCLVCGLKKQCCPQFMLTTSSNAMLPHQQSNVS